MNAATSARSAALSGTGTCRLTVAGQAKRADMTVPATVTVGELLPLLLSHVVDEADRGQPWVLQRLGGEPLDPDATAEMLDLRDGETLYLRPGQHAMPAMEFDDLAAGVATVLSGRSDRWQPAFTRRLLLSLACLALTAFTLGVMGVQPGWRLTLYLGVAAVALGAGCVLVTRRLADPATGLITGLSACALAALAGLSNHRGLPGILGPGRDDLLLAGVCAGAVAGAVLAAGRVPITPYGAVLATAGAAVTGSWLALALHWDATRAAAVTAVLIFMTGSRSLRLVLRAVRLRVPQLPGTADELQQDIEPEPEDRVIRRAASAVAYLNSLTISSSVVFAVAFIQLVRSPQWIGWTLAAVLSGAVLLRARELVGLWQRAALAICGTLGLALVLDVLAARATPVTRAAMLCVLLVSAAALLAAAWRLPARRPLPIWGHAADLLETWTAIALVPLLLQLLHVYAFFSALIG
jgi:type VII secretion integral membrane protein EccD